MSEFESLFNKLLEQKPDLTKEEIEGKIKEKKEKIGAGYLTDQGALFLIASDLGVSLSEPLKVEMGLKDLYVGAKEISLETRVLNLSPAKQYSRKDGSPFFLRTMTVYDGDSTASVKLWDEKAKLPGIEELKPGDLIKIIKAYVKSDLNGSPTINIGSGASIETSDVASNIPIIDNITRDVSTVKENENNLVVSGTVDGIINTLEFTNSRGQPGKALRLRLKGSTGDSVRIVLWGKDESSVPKMVSPGAKTILFGVKTKTGNQGLEIHGNEATIIKIQGENEIKPVVARILSISKNDAGKNMILGVDSKKNIFKITDSVEKIKLFNVGEVIECMPSKAYGNSIVLDDDSFVRKVEDDTIPSVSELRTKISDIKIGEDYCIEAIILKKPERREVQTKTGESIALSEMYVEDDTGPIFVKGWRNLARLLDKFSIGEVISVTGLTAKTGLENKMELFLTAFSSITKKN
ncbi:MAG TPA: single-stranded DNA-binding protein [Nitrosopumilaceae archaeon]|nr:single-stranded DNA-binding protein [Nitrosopumilaceae archaeon]